MHSNITKTYPFTFKELKQEPDKIGNIFPNLANSSFHGNSKSSPKSLKLEGGSTPSFIDLKLEVIISMYVCMYVCILILPCIISTKARLKPSVVQSQITQYKIT